MDQPTKSSNAVPIIVTIILVILLIIVFAFASSKKSSSSTVPDEESISNQTEEINSNEETIEGQTIEESPEAVSPTS